MKKLILAFDSFKGSLDSMSVANEAKSAILKVFPQCEVLIAPIADGGEGTTNAICANLDVNYVSCTAHNPLMQPIVASYAIAKDGKTAILEMAAASGLPLIPIEDRDPMNSTTFGTGEMIADALNRGCRNFIIGIGGSATNDAGVGVLAALGYRFFDAQNNIVAPVGRNLSQIMHVDDANRNRALDNATFTIACDVNNPFYGETGAAHIYAPQKGASPIDVKLLDDGLRHYAKIIASIKGIDISSTPGAGAAGGMGGGLLPFLNATLKSGIDTILDIQNFTDMLVDADLVITGEGKLDAQTGMGKALGGILERANAASVPVIAIAGCVDNVEQLNEMGFTATLSIQPSPTTLEQAMQPDSARQNIRHTITQIARIIAQFHKKNNIFVK